MKSKYDIQILLLVILGAGLIIGGLAHTIWTTGGTLRAPHPPAGAPAPTVVVHADSDSGEYSAVQQVVGPSINPEVLLDSAMNSTGYEALEQAGSMSVTATVFLSYQQHPSLMMARIQSDYCKFDSGPEGVFEVETVNQSIQLLDFTGLTAGEEASLITRLCGG